MTPRMPSIGFSHDRFEDERDRDLRHFESLETKAGLVLGFAGVLAALTGGRGSFVGFFALCLAALAAFGALLAFWPRDLPVLNAARLRNYLTAEERITRLVLVDTYLSHFEQSRALLHRKAGILKLAMALLAASAAISALDRIVMGS